MHDHSLTLGGLHVSWDDPAAGRADVGLAGELDNLSAPVLRQVMDALLGAGCYDVALDVHELTFVDSSGISEVVAAWRRCQRAGGSITVRNAAPHVRRLLELTGVGDLLVPPS